MPATLNAVAIGDSCMWGQGLRDENKYSTTSVQEIGELLGRSVNVLKNSPRSGATIKAALTDKEAIDKYRDFVNAYPHLFPPGFPPEELEKNFNDHNKELVEDAAYRLYGEVPAPFPSVLHQLKRIPEANAREAHLVLINGAANDLDFEELLNPEEYRETFVKHYGPILDEICYSRVRAVLR